MANANKAAGVCKDWDGAGVRRRRFAADAAAALFRRRTLLLP
jgi:hypothetical protein